MGFDNECIVNIQSLPGEFFCPVCRTLVYPNEALQSQCTHLYCKPCLSYIVATTQACPYDGYLVTEADSKPLIESDKSVAESIGKVAVHCLYYRSGCQWQGTLSECIVHSGDCNFGNSLVVCNRCGAQIIHRQVQEHAQSCPGLQPQGQQAESSQAQTSAVTTQAPPQDQSAAASAPATSSTPTSTAAIPASAPITTTSASAVAVAASSAAAPTVISLATGVSQNQGNVAGQTQTAVAPTPEQLYQQQLQYQQYYQQYHGYDPYHQYYQQYGQYPQQVYQQYQQAPAQQVYQGQQQPYTIPQTQPQPQSLPQSQAHAQQQATPQLQLQPQPHLQQPVPQGQPQLQPQPQPQPQSQTYPHPRPAQMQGPQSLAPQPLPQAYPAPHTQIPGQQIGQPPVQHQPHLPFQPSQQTIPHGQNQQVVATHLQPNMQMQHPNAQSQHPPQHQAVQQSNIQLQPRPPLHSQPQAQAAQAVTGYQSYPQQQSFQQFPSNAQQHPMQMPMQPQGPPQQRPQLPGPMQNQFLAQQQPLMRPPQSHIPMQVAQQTGPLPPQGPRPLPQQPGQPAQHPPSMRPQQQALHPQPYQQVAFPSQQAMHPASRPAMSASPFGALQPHPQQNILHSQGAAARPIITNPGIAQQAFQHSSGMNQLAQLPLSGNQGAMAPVSPRTEANQVAAVHTDKRALDNGLGTSAQDVVQSGKSPKVVDGSKAINTVSGQTEEGSESADFKLPKPKTDEEKEKAMLSGSQISGEHDKVEDQEGENAGKEGIRLKSSGINKSHSEDDEAVIKLDGGAPENDAHQLSDANSGGLNKIVNRGLHQLQPQQNPAPGQQRPLLQSGYLDRNVSQSAQQGTGPNDHGNIASGTFSGQGRYFMHQGPSANPPGIAGPAPMSLNMPPAANKGLPQQMPYSGQERRFADPQFSQMQSHGLPAAPNQIRPPMHNLPGIPPQGLPSAVSGGTVHLGPHRTFEQQGMAQPMHGHFPHDNGSRLPHGTSHAPPMGTMAPPGALNSFPGARGSALVSDDHAMRHPGFLDGKGFEERFRPITDERSAVGRRDFEDGLKQFSGPAHLNGDPMFEAYTSSSRPLESGLLDRSPYGMDVGERRKPFGPPDDMERMRDVDSRMDVHRPLSDFGRNRFDGMPPPRSPVGEYSGLPSGKFMGQFPMDDFGRRDLHGFGERSRAFNPPPDPPGSAFHEDFPRRHFREPYGQVFPNSIRSGEALGGHSFPLFMGDGDPHGHGHFRVGEPGFGRRYVSGEMDSFEYARKRKPGSGGWCRICKIDCETVDRLDMHVQTVEHQKMAMDMVLSIKREVAKKKKLTTGESFSPDDAVKSRKANFENRGNRK